MTEDETVGWHYQFDGHEFEQAPGVGDGQGSLECCTELTHLLVSSPLPQYPQTLSVLKYPPSRAPHHCQVRASLPPPAPCSLF